MAKSNRRSFLKHGFTGLAAIGATGAAGNALAHDQPVGAQNFDLTGPWLRSCHVHELWNPRYPYRELFALFRSVGYNRYTFAEIQGSCEPIRLMHYYRKMWEYEAA